MCRDNLDTFVSQILLATGCTPEGTQPRASVLSHTNSRGIPLRGVNQSNACANEIQAGLVDPQAVPVVESCGGATAIVHGQNGLGAVTSQLTMETALKWAQQHGVVLQCVHNHCGAAGCWAQMTLDRGCIGMLFANTSPFAVLTHSKVQGLVANPFCFFAPETTKDGFQLDMTTTTLPVGKVEVLNRLGQLCPSGWGVKSEWQKLF